jgi:hypothetical protein
LTIGNTKPAPALQQQQQARWQPTKPFVLMYLTGVQMIDLCHPNDATSIESTARHQTGASANQIDAFLSTIKLSGNCIDLMP